MSTSELAVSYASLILADADVDPTVSREDHGGENSGLTRTAPI